MAVSRVHILRVFVPFALGYFLSYLYRGVNAVLAPNLISDLGLGPAELGLLTAAYFLAFGAFQLPLGILLDRFGSKNVEAILLLFASIGAFIFAGAKSVSALIAGRAFIGFGVSACLMAAFTAFVVWFPSRRLPLANGVQMTAGGLGALAATAPVEAALHITNWRGVFSFLAVITLTVAAIVFFVVPQKKPKRSDTSLKEQLSGILTVFTSPFFWRIAPLATISQATFLAVQGLWAGPWLRDVAGLDRTSVANVLFLIAAAMVAGFFLIGVIAERLTLLGIKPLSVAVFGMTAFMLFQILIILEATSITLPTWIGFGVFGTTGILTYAVLSQHFPPHLAGRANTGINLLVFIGAFLVQWSIGAVLELWPTTVGERYAPRGYQAAYGLILALQVMALAWFFFFPGQLRHRNPHPPSPTKR